MLKLSLIASALVLTSVAALAQTAAPVTPTTSAAPAAIAAKPAAAASAAAPIAIAAPKPVEVVKDKIDAKKTHHVDAGKATAVAHTPVTPAASVPAGTPTPTAESHKEAAKAVTLGAAAPAKAMTAPVLATK